MAEEVEREAHRLRVREAARDKVTAERLASQPLPLLDLGTLADVLARPAEPPYRVEGLIPWEASTLIVAQRKVGKTTILANLVRSLLLGQPFLDRFAVRSVAGRLALLNYEVSGATLARWMAEAGVPADRLVLVNLRGRSNPLGDPRQRERLAEALREHKTEGLIVDPFGRAFTGTSQNDAGEVQGCLTDLDLFARSEVGARDLILTTHAGWNGERSRGSTALEDWADSILTITRAEDDARYLRAMGRDVEFEEDRLHFDPVARRLSLTGAGSRSTVAQREQVETALGLVLAHLADHEGCSQRGLEKEVPGRAEVVREAARLGVERGLIRVEQRGRTRLHHLSNSYASECVPLHPGRTSEGASLRPYRDADATHGASDSPEINGARDA